MIRVPKFAQRLNVECDRNLSKSPAGRRFDFNAIALKVLRNARSSATLVDEAYLRVTVREIRFLLFLNSSIERTCFCTDSGPDKRSSRWGLILRSDWLIINHVANS